MAFVFIACQTKNSFECYICEFTYWAYAASFDCHKYVQLASRKISFRPYQADVVEIT